MLREQPIGHCVSVDLDTRGGKKIKHTMVARLLGINVKNRWLLCRRKGCFFWGLLFGISASLKPESLAVLFVPVGPCTALPPRLPQHKKLLWVRPSTESIIVDLAFYPPYFT